MASASSSNTWTLAQMVYASCCRARNVKVNVQIFDQLNTVAAPQIETIDASQTFLGAQGIHALLDFVGIHQNIQHVDLCKNGMDADNVNHLCKLIESHRSLVSINLSKNQFSVPSVRALWESVKSCNRIQDICFEGTNVPEEWDNRIGRCLAQNCQYQQEGFLKEPKRHPSAWENAFVAVLGPANLLPTILDEVLQVINSLAASSQVRVAPIVILDTDTPETIVWKISLCRDIRNYNLPRVVLVLDSNNFASVAVQHALEYATTQLSVPEIPPLRNKLGVQRDPVQRCAPFLFVYTSASSFGDDWDTTRFDIKELSPAEAERMASFTSLKKTISAVPSVVHYEFHSKETLVLRSQTDLYGSFSTVYGPLCRPRHSTTTTGGAVKEVTDSFVTRVSEMYEQYAVLGKSHTQDVEEVLRYINSTPTAQAHPLILYGGEGVGKSHVAAHVALQLMAQSHEYNHLIVPMIGGHKTSTSPVVMCYYLLSAFQPSALNVFYPTLDALAEACNKAIANYSGKKRISVFMVGLDKIDHGGKREFSLLTVFPSTLPVNVRMVITLATESPLLVGFRGLVPQPYEKLVRSLPPSTLLSIVQQRLAKFNMVIPGLEPEVTTEAALAVAVSSALPSVVKIILQKEDVESHAYCELLGLLMLHNASQLVTVEDTLRFVQEAVPPTVNALFVRVMEYYNKSLGEASMRAALLSLTVSPLPITELILICERLGSCPPYTVLPIVLQLLDDGLLVMFRDAIVNIANPSYISAIKDCYGSDALFETSTLVASHMHRLVVTLSPEMSFCFRRCILLLLESMQLDVVESLVLDPVVMDKILSTEERSRPFAIDALFRLLNADAVHRELLAIHTLQFQRNEKRRELRLALFQLQSDYPLRPEGAAANFFQCALLGHRDNPYRIRAEAAALALRAPYPVLVPRNTRGQEANSVLSVDLNAAGTHCHSLGDTMVATTATCVFVYTLSSLAVVAQLEEPFGASVPLLGALVASESRVLVIAADQIILWDLALGSWTLIPDVTTSLSGHSFDVTRTALLCCAPANNQLVLLDLNKRKVVQRLPYDGVVREAVFAGMQNMILVATVYEVVVIVDEEQKVVLSHPSVVRAMASSPDGKFIVVAVENVIYLWTWKGDLLHLCSEHTATVNDLAFHPNGSMFVSCSDDQTVKVWKTLTGLVVSDLPFDIHSSSSQQQSSCQSLPVVPQFVQFSNDGTRIFARCDDFVCQWDTITFASAGAVCASSGFINFISVAVTHVIAVTSGAELKVWTFKSAFPTCSQASTRNISSCILLEAKISNAAVRCVKTAPRGEFLMVRDASNQVTIWNSASGVLQSTLSKVDAFCALDGFTLFTIEQNKIVVFSFASNECIGSYSLPRDTPVDPSSYDMLFTPDGSQLLVIVNAASSTRIHVFELPSFKLSNIFIGHFGAVTYLSKLNEDLLISAGEDGTVRLWSLSGHAERVSYKHHSRIVSAIDVMGATVEHPILFIDDAGDVYDVLLSAANSAEQALIRIEKKRLVRDGGSKSGGGGGTGTTPRHHRSTADSDSAAAAVTLGMSLTHSISSPDSRTRLTYASRLTNNLMLIADDLGALYMVDEHQGRVVSTISRAKCSCTPHIRGSLALIGTADGAVSLYDIAVPATPQDVS